MVDVGRKPPLQRIATAEGFLVAAKATIDRIMSTPPRKARSAGGRGSGGAGEPLSTSRSAAGPMRASG